VCVCADMCVVISGSPSKPKRVYRKHAQPSEHRRSARLELKRREIEQLLMTQPVTTDSSSSSNVSSDDSSNEGVNDGTELCHGVSRCETSTAAAAASCEELAEDDGDSDSVKCERSSAAAVGSAAAADDGSHSASDAVYLTTQPVSCSDHVLKRKRKRRRGRPRKLQSDTAVIDMNQVLPPVHKRPRGRPRKFVRPTTDVETKLPAAAAGSASVDRRAASESENVIVGELYTGDELTQIDNISRDYLTTEPHFTAAAAAGGGGPFTLSLSPPPMPAGRVAQPTGVLMLPLYSSVPTEYSSVSVPTEPSGHHQSSSLMLVQPHQLAVNLPFAVGGTVSETPLTQPMLAPAAQPASSPPSSAANVSPRQ